MAYASHLDQARASRRHYEKKHGAIGDLVGSVAPRRIVAEIKKCDVRCANCHRRKTAKDFGWYKDCADLLAGIPVSGEQQVMFEDDLNVT